MICLRWQGSSQHIPNVRVINGDGDERGAYHVDDDVVAGIAPGEHRDKCDGDECCVEESGLDDD